MTKATAPKPSKSKDVFDKSVATKTTAFKCLPENIYMVKSSKHPTLGHLFGKRALDPPDPFLVDSINELGNRTPITIVKAPALTDGVTEPQPGTPVCEVGRRRINAALEVNRQRRNAAKKAGVEILDGALIWMKCVYDGDPAELQLAGLIIENMGRQDDDLLTQAEQICRLLRGNGGDKKAAARVAHRSLSTIENLIKLNALPACVKQAVLDEKISSSGALEYHGLSATEAAEKLREQTEDGTKRAKLGEVRRSLGKVRAPPKKELIEHLDSIAERVTPQLRSRMSQFTWKNTERESPDFLAGILYGARWARGVK